MGLRETTITERFCDRCGETKGHISMVGAVDYCVECHPDRKACEMCGSKQFMNPAFPIVVEGKTICTQCIDDHATECTQCFAYYFNYNIVKIENNIVYCRECASNPTICMVNKAIYDVLQETIDENKD